MEMTEYTETKPDIWSDGVDFIKIQEYELEMNK